MGIVVMKEPRPNYSYKHISQVDEHCSINMELGIQNGVSTKHQKKFANKRWNQMLNRSENNRYTTSRDGQQVRPSETTYRR